MFSIRTDVTGLPGGSGVYLHYFAGPGSMNSAEVTEGGVRVAAFWNSLKGLVGTGVTWTQQNTGDEIDPTTGSITNQISAGSATTIGSSATGDHMPGATCYVLQYLTGHFTGGRQVRGRIFVGPPTENQNAPDGTVPGTTITSLNTALALLSHTNVTAIGHVVWHRPGDRHGNPGAAVLVTSYSVSSQFGFLRSHGA